jgi:hypothetical protein
MILQANRFRQTLRRYPLDFNPIAGANEIIYWNAALSMRPVEVAVCAFSVK